MGASENKLKKPSDASLPSLPDPLVFFTDANLGRYIIPSALRAAGMEVRTHDQLFAAGTPDAKWLRQVGQRGWIVLTKDTRIRYRANETNALFRAKARAFVLTARGDLKGEEIGAVFVKALPAIKKLCAEAKPPFIAHVTREGKVVLVKT